MKEEEKIAEVAAAATNSVCCLPPSWAPQQQQQQMSEGHLLFSLLGKTLGLPNTVPSLIDALSLVIIAVAGLFVVPTSLSLSGLD